MSQPSCPVSGFCGPHDCRLEKFLAFVNEDPQIRTLLAQLEPGLRKQENAGNLKNNACPVCKGVEEHGQDCIATRLFKTLARVGGGVRRGEVPTVDEMFLKACGIDTEEAAWLKTNMKH
jgi:hypothetical protein